MVVKRSFIALSMTVNVICHYSVWINSRIIILLQKRANASSELWAWDRDLVSTGQLKERQKAAISIKVKLISAVLNSRQRPDSRRSSLTNNPVSSGAPFWATGAGGGSWDIWIPSSPACPRSATQQETSGEADVNYFITFPFMDNLFLNTLPLFLSHTEQQNDTRNIHSC